MATGKGRKRTTTTVVEDDPVPGNVAEGETVALETGDSMETDAIAELLALGGGDGVKWTVKRVSAKPGQQSGYCATYTSGELSLDVIRDSFGGGKYAIRGTDAAGRYVAASTVEIVDLPKQPTAAAAPVAPPQDLNGIAAIIAAMKPSGDSNSEVLKLLTAIVMKPAPPPPEQLGITEIISLVKSLQGDGKSGTQQLLDGIKLGRELAGGGGGEEPSMLGIASKGLEMIAPLIAREAATPRPAPPRPRPPPSMTLPPGAPAESALAQPPAAQPVQLQPTPQPQPEANPMLRQIQWLTAQVRSLVYQASRDSDPELYAAVLIDNLPDFISEDEIRSRFSDPNAIAMLEQFNPAVGNFAPWFEKFRVAVLEMLTDDDEPPGGVIEGDPASIVGEGEPQ